MKRFLPPLIFVIAVAGLAALLPMPARGDRDDSKAAPAEPHISRDTNGNVVIKLDDDVVKQAGLKLEAAAAAQFAPELKAYGRVLDPGPLGALLTDAASAQAAAVASSNELVRLKTLSASGNASARALEAADAAALRDQLTAQSARDRLMLSWGREIADRSGRPDFLQSLTTLNAVLIRVDLPAGRRLDSSPASVRVVRLDGHAVAAQFLGAALTIDPQTEGQGFILEVKPNESQLLPGEAVTAYLKVSGEPLAGVAIPRDAVVRTEGKGWVYIAGADNHFTRKEIALDRATDSGWFVTNGVAAGEQIVVTGAQSLLSEETKTSLPPD